jgi:hypothetical protein
MATWDDIEKEQKDICKRLNVLWTPVDRNLMIAINNSLFTDTLPINGLRHPREESIDGWYIWSGGEIPQDQVDFFDAIHAEHLLEKRPSILKYLGLPDGYRFQIDNNGHEDIWFDKAILDI